MIVDTVAADAIAKIDDRFFLLDPAQRFGQRLQGLELAVGVEDVELAIVGGECLAGVGRAFRVAGRARAKTLTGSRV